MKIQDVRVGKRIFTIKDDVLLTIDILNVNKYSDRMYIEYIGVSESGNIECFEMFIRKTQLNNFWLTPRALKNKL